MGEEYMYFDEAMMHCERMIEEQNKEKELDLARDRAAEAAYD